MKIGRIVSIVGLVAFLGALLWMLLNFIICPFLLITVLDDEYRAYQYEKYQIETRQPVETKQPAPSEE